MFDASLPSVEPPGAQSRTMKAAMQEKHEVVPRVERVEQQLDALPPAWKAFAGPPMAMHYYGTRINTFRANLALQRPPTAFCDWAVGALRRQLGADAVGLTDAELRDIVSQEWRSDLARSVMQARINRHGSACGPVVQRSARGVLSVVAPPAPTSSSPQPPFAPKGRAPARPTFMLDAITTPPRERRSREGRQ